MSSKRDGLDGYRGIRPEALRQAVAKADDADPDRSKYQRMVLGVAAEKLMAGIASGEEVKGVMAAVIQEAERNAKAQMQALLAMPDLDAPEAKAAHFEARVAGQVLTYLNNMIRSGHSASRELAGDNEGDS